MTAGTVLPAVSVLVAAKVLPRKAGQIAWIVLLTVTVRAVATVLPGEAVLTAVIVLAVATGLPAGVQGVRQPVRTSPPVPRRSASPALSSPKA